jgi:hypothetical protein
VTKTGRGGRELHRYVKEPSSELAELAADQQEPMIKEHDAGNGALFWTSQVRGATKGPDHPDLG